MTRFIAATKNKGKLKEIVEILSGFPLQVVSMEQAGVDGEIDECGSTFEENAIIKARAVFERTAGIVMADDSGLEVDFLDGAPGVYSARFGGEGASDEDRYNKLLGMLRDVPLEKRSARFVSAVAVILPDESYFIVRGACEGYIGFKPEGDNGFGYDPVFFLPEYGMTIAQLASSEKNAISHRGKAIRLMAEELHRRWKEK